MCNNVGQTRLLRVLRYVSSLETYMYSCTMPIYPECKISALVTGFLNDTILLH